MKSSSQYLLLQQTVSEDFLESFQELRTAGELFDVTLACEDEVVVEAHKVVLSASSPWFRNVFRKTKQANPFIYLRGLLYKDLVALVDYIYSGKAQILADDIDRFIQVARDLKIKSLAEEFGEVKDGEKMENESVEEVEEQLNPQECFADSSMVKCEDKGLDQLQKEISERIEKVSDMEGEVLWKCTVCGKTMKKKFHMQNHVETHLDGYSHKCIYCGKAHKTRGALSAHVSFTHRNVVGTGNSNISDEVISDDNNISTVDESENTSMKVQHENVVE